MLCDSWLEFMQQRGGPVHAGGPFPPHFAPDIPELRELKRAQRFVFAPDAMRVASDLADAESVERVRYAAFAPAQETWLEWSDPGNGKRVGVLLTADGGSGSKLAVAGHGVFVTDAIAVSGLRDYVALPIFWNLAGPGPAVVLNAEPVILDFVRMGFPGFVERLDVEQLGYWLVAALSLLNAQRVTTMQDADLSRLNKWRREKGRAEFLAHREIILTLTAEQVIAARAKLNGLGARCIMCARTFACCRAARRSSVSIGAANPVSASRASATSFGNRGERQPLTDEQCGAPNARCMRVQ
jgi:hypothetical protein